MKKLFTALFTFILFTNTYCQELFSGNWKPTDDQKWFNTEFETKAKYTKNFNIFNDDIFIVSYLNERDYIEYRYKNPLTVFDKSQFKERKDFHEEVLDYDEKNIKTIFYNSKNNYRVYINYYLKNKTKIIATYIDFDTNKTKGIVAYHRKK
tara:strand:- start:95 stop:547 length:453 start_codon:yes stop_codon:yes gene_type:complete